MTDRRSALRAARTATFVAGAALLLLLSRSEIRKTLFANPVAVPLVAGAIWGLGFAAAWWRSADRPS